MQLAGCHEAESDEATNRRGTGPAAVFPARFSRGRDLQQETEARRRDWHLEIFFLPLRVFAWVRLRLRLM